MERTMSEQEMQFADPDWKPGQSGTLANQARPLTANNQRPSAISPVMPPVDAGERAYSQGYTGEAYVERDEQAQLQQGYLQPQPRRRRGSPPWLVVGIIVFALIFVLGLAQGYQATRGFNGLPDISHSVSFAKPQHGFPFQDGQQFKIGPSNILNVVNLTGSITVVTGGLPGVVTVQPSRSDSFFGSHEPLQDSALQTSQSGDGALTVTVNADSSNVIDVTITVPQGIILNLQTQDGNISVSDIIGQMTLSSGSGDIELEGDTLQQHSSIQTDSGDIDFTGAIDPHGTYQLSSNSGDITVGLGGGTPYHLHAISQSGTFTGNGAASSFSSGDGNGINQQGNVGSNPQASLTLQTQSGDIDLTS
jgi:hypothetical protein